MWVKQLQLTLAGMLREIEPESRKAYVPVLTQPDLNDRTGATMTRRLNGWLG